MAKALGMVELQTVSAGLQAADCMLKAAAITLVQAHAVCPGKYIALVSGELSAVKAAVDAAALTFGGRLLDQFVLGNPHEGIFPALCGGANLPEHGALGIVESFTAASAIVAADTAAKTADVTLLELRLARGLCGKSFVTLTGSLAAVDMAVARARSAIEAGGLYLDSAVLPNPDPALWRNIV